MMCQSIVLVLVMLVVVSCGVSSLPVAYRFYQMQSRESGRDRRI